MTVGRGFQWLGVCLTGHEGHYRALDTVCHMPCYFAFHGVTRCYTVGQQLREDYPVITLSISSLTAATVGSGMWGWLSKAAISQPLVQLQLSSDTFHSALGYFSNQF